MKETLVCLCVVFLGSRLIMASDVITVNCSETVIMGQYGSSVVLPCWLTPEMNAEALEIRWYRPGLFKSPLLFYQNSKIITDYNTYKNRSSLTLRNPQSTGLKQGDISLRLDNLGLSDIGIFHCYVTGDKSYHEKTVTLNLTALGSLPFLSLKDHHDSVNLSCSSCGWFPQPSLLWKSTTEKGEALSDPRSHIYSRQENGLFCVYSWVILSSSVSNSISCSVSLSEDKERDVSLDLGARLSVDNSVVWKILFTLLCVLVLIGIALLLYRKYKPGYKPVSTEIMVDLRKDQPDTNLEVLRKSAVTITLDMENCNKHYLKFNPQGDMVRDTPEAANCGGHGFPYELCVRGRNVFHSGRSYWEVGFKNTNVPLKKSWLIGVTKASNPINDQNSDFTTSEYSWFLSSNPEKGLCVNTKPEISLLENTTPECIGVLLDFDNRKLSFYNVHSNDCEHLFTMFIDFQEDVVPLFNPGIGEKAPLNIIKLQDKIQNEPGGSASAQVSNADQRV